MSGTDAPAARVCATVDHVACEVAGQTVILSLPQGVYFGLDDVGSTIWKLLQQPTTAEAIRAALVLEYDVDPDRCEGDVRRLLGEFAHHGLIRFEDAAAA